MLASRAMVMAGFGVILVEEISIWITSTINLLDSHFDDEITLEDPALFALLNAAAYIMNSCGVERLRPLVFTLVQALSALDSQSTSQAHGLMGLALTSFALVRHGLGDLWDIYRHYESQPPLTDTARESLILFGLLDLLKHDDVMIPEDSELVTITQSLCHFLPRPNMLNIYSLPDQTLDSYFKNQIEPRIAPESDGSFTNSENVRSAHLSVVNGSFLENRTSQEIIHIFSLALENLWSAKSSNLKQSCCDILSDHCFYGISDSIDWRDQAQLLKPLLRGLESNDDRVLPYLMTVIWRISRRIIQSDMPATEKHDLLGPALPHELFIGAAQTQGNPRCPPQALFEMAETWLLRLEKMQGGALLHIRKSEILSHLQVIFWQRDSKHGGELKNRASALSQRCDVLYESDRGQAPWSEDSEAD
ncbi:hypothetical protein FRC08_010041 [Ceratobasidium sp. 394]|nr:hypothetical protein FRC08_010041 [Ceratobasidium sp. 394]KAG9079570.1 hypothetical protein FS749_008409 [Ceratobasidium sp. UAMH 11750]